MFRADLHCHSTCSDGTMTPEEILHHAKEQGLSGLAITDHDTVEAYQTVLSLAAEVGVKMVTGIEFSSSLMGHSVHILGYGFHPKAPSIIELCGRHKIRRKQRNEAMIEKLNRCGITVDQSDLQRYSKGETVGRPHLAMAMIEKGYVEDFNEAFKGYLGEEAKCYVKSDEITAQETVQAIHDANGFAVIAHPMLIKHSTVVKELLKLPFDGIEGYYAKMPLHIEKRWVDVGKAKGWLITGGSDFHGSVKKHITLGSSWVGEEVFEAIQNRFYENYHLNLVENVSL